MPDRRMLVLALAAILAGCSGQGSTLSPEAERGRQIYAGQCTSCHSSDPSQNGPLGPENAIGQIEKPVSFQPAAGTVTVSGWAIDPEGISRIDIKVNGQLAGTATLTGTRADVRELYLSIDPILSRGFTFSYDTHATNDGNVTFEAWVFDLNGNETLIGQSTVNIDQRDHP